MPPGDNRRASCWTGERDEALKDDPHFIACDAGSTDPGPFSLGSGEPAFAREAVKRDLAALLDAGRRAGIPVLIGSAGTAGGEVVPKRWGLSWRPQPQPSNSLPSLPSSAASRSCTIPSQNGAALPPASRVSTIPRILSEDPSTVSTSTMWPFPSLRWSCSAQPSWRSDKSYCYMSIKEH